MNEKKVLLNYLPPATVYYPSPSLSILKSFLNKNNFPAEIKYWNFKLNSIITECLDEEITDVEIKLMPFYALLAEATNDREVTNKILAYLHKVRPDIYFSKDDTYENYLEKIKHKALKIINAELDKIDFKNILLFGISYKLYQWISGISIAKVVKERSPDTKIIIGGIENRESALTIMKLCKEIDFAIWGEGEYPMLDICTQLKNGKQSFDDIARFIYREGGKIIQSRSNTGKYLDFDNYIFPDYDDYAPLSKKLKQKKFEFYPINSLRSCYWKKCKFCNYSQGYRYRERRPQSIIDEIVHINRKYGTEQFMFVDNDIIGTNINRFEDFLNRLIKLQSDSNYNIALWCEMILHADLNDEIIKKMAIAGFSEMFIGYEGVSDSILRKMNKSNDFALNILVVKSALKHGIKVKTNLIKGIPDETKEDVLESINNLHYLRFFFNQKPYSLFHIHGPFALHKEAKYYKTLSADEISRYDSNPTSYFVPRSFLETPSALFGYLKKSVDNAHEWNSFTAIESLYTKNTYSYKFERRGGRYYYYEYINSEKDKDIEFFDPIYIDVLKYTSDKVCSFDELRILLQKKHKRTSDKKLTAVLHDLKEAYLIYYNNDMSRIISVVDVK